MKPSLRRTVARHLPRVLAVVLVGGLGLVGCAAPTTTVSTDRSAAAADSGGPSAAATPEPVTATDVSGPGGGGPDGGVPVAVAGINDRGDVAGDWPERGRGFLFAGGELRDLPLGSATRITVGAINERGQVAGAADAGRGRYQPLVWTDGEIAVLGPPGTGTSKDINDRGDVLIDNGTTVVVATGGRLVRVPAMPGAVKQYGHAINNRGLVIGSAEIDRPDGSRVTRSYLWDGHRVTDLGTLDPRLGAFSHVRATAINDRGEVVGISGTATDDSHAFRWVNGRMTDLGTLGGRSSFATDINERSQIVGYSATRDEDVHAFRWDDGNLTDLGVLGGDHSEARAVNDSGQIAGTSTDRSGTTTHATLWVGGRTTDLGVPAGFTSGDATGVNAAGQIVGTATTGERTSHAFVWTVGG